MSAAGNSHYSESWFIANNRLAHQTYHKQEQISPSVTAFCNATNNITMPAYHSSYNEEKAEVVCGCAVLPIKTKIKQTLFSALPASDTKDIVDETLYYFKANVLFRNYEVKGPADRVLIYLTFYVHYLLLKMERKNVSSKDEADKLLFQLARDNYPTPGEPGFLLGGFFPSGTPQERDTWNKYMSVLREETGLRLKELVFQNSPDGKPNKFWMLFSKKKFLNKTMEN